jgi:hypothetical protein
VSVKVATTTLISGTFAAPVSVAPGEITGGALAAFVMVICW